MAFCSAVAEPEHFTMRPRITWKIIFFSHKRHDFPQICSNRRSCQESVPDRSCPLFFSVDAPVGCYQGSCQGSGSDQSCRWKFPEGWEGGFGSRHDSTPECGEQPHIHPHKRPFWNEFNGVFSPAKLSDRGKCYICIFDLVIFSPLIQVGKAIVSQKHILFGVIHLFYNILIPWSPSANGIQYVRTQSHHSISSQVDYCPNRWQLTYILMVQWDGNTKDLYEKYEHGMEIRKI